MKLFLNNVAGYVSKNPVSTSGNLLAVSGDQHQPPSPDRQEHTQKEERCQQSQPVEFALFEIATADEDDILTSP